MKFWGTSLLVFGIGIILGIILFFPWSRLEFVLENYLFQKTGLISKVSKISYNWPLGLKISKIEVYLPEHKMVFTEVKLSPGLFFLKIDGKLAQGSVEAKFNPLTKRGDLRLKHVQGVKFIWPKAVGKIWLWANFSWPEFKAKGKVIAKDVSFTFFCPGLRQKISLSQVQIASLFNLEKNVLFLQKGEVKNPNALISFAGKIEVEPENLGRSKLRLKAKVILKRTKGLPSDLNLFLSSFLHKAVFFKVEGKLERPTLKPQF